MAEFYVKNGKKVELHCPNCQKTFKRWPSELSKGEKAFCSRKCKTEYYWPKGHQPWNAGLPRELQPHFGRHHSEDAKRHIAEAQKGQHHSPATEFKFQGGPITNVCEVCGKEFQVKRYRDETARFCSLSCHAKTKVGSKHPFYGHKHSVESIQKMLKARNKGLHVHPNRAEQKFIDICAKHGLPYRFVGDGQLIIGVVNPDFVNVDDEHELVEIFSEYWHNPEKRKVAWHQTFEGRKAYLAERGYKATIIWDFELKDEAVVLAKFEV